MDRLDDRLYRGPAVTRINLVDPKVLSDQHLFAEWREMPRVATELRKRLVKGPFVQTLDSYRMGTGHMLFFYDKMGFLEKRYRKIVRELKRRNYSFTEYEDNPFSGFDEQYSKPYRPSIEEVNTSKKRLVEKLDMRPNWYRHFGDVKSSTYFKGLLE